MSTSKFAAAGSNDRLVGGTVKRGKVRKLKAGAGMAFEARLNSIMQCPGADDFKFSFSPEEIPPSWVQSGNPPALRGQLMGTIESEIIPRLMLAYGGGLVSGAEAAAAVVTDEQVSDLARRAVCQNLTELRAYIEGVIAKGTPLTEVFLSLLAPAARRLGEWWTQDECDFTAVTVGLTRLQQLVFDLGPAFGTSGPGPDEHASMRSVLLVPAPGEQHTFGLILVGEFFRRAGWQVTCAPAVDRRQLLDFVKVHRFDVLGISLSAENHFNSTQSIIREVRSASRNGAIQVMVGGAAIAGNEGIGMQLGADGTSSDGRLAAARAANLLDSLTNRC